MRNSVIIFYSTHYAIRASDALINESIENKMIPVPRKLSSDCGYCIRIKSEDSKIVEKILKDNDIEYDRVEQLA